MLEKIIGVFVFLLEGDFFGTKPHFHTGPARAVVLVCAGWSACPCPSVQGHTESQEQLGPAGPCRSPEGHADSTWVAVGSSWVYATWESLSETLTGKFASRTSQFLRFLWWLIVTCTQRVGILKYGELLFCNIKEQSPFPEHFCKSSTREFPLSDKSW